MNWLYSVLTDFVLNKLWGAFVAWQARRKARQDALRDVQLDQHQKAQEATHAAQNEPDSLSDDEFLMRVRDRDKHWNS